MNEELTSTEAVSVVLPILYIRPGCPESDDALSFMAKHSIGFHRKDVSRDPVAMIELQHKSRQAKAPLLDWHGRLLSHFGVEQLKSFLQQQNVAFADSQPAAV